MRKRSRSEKVVNFRKKENQNSRDQVDNEEQWTALITELYETELNSIPDTVVLEQRYQLSDHFYQRMEKLVDRMNRRERRQSYTRGIVAAAAVILLCLCLANPLMIIEAKNKLVEWFETYIEFHFTSQEMSEIIPEYHLGYVPQGYEQTKSFYYEVSGGSSYSNGEDDLEFYYAMSDSEMMINNEGVSYHELIEKDGTVIYYLESEEEKENSSFIWISEDKTTTFYIEGNLSEEELRKIKNNVKE